MNDHSGSKNSAVVVKQAEKEAKSQAEIYDRKGREVFQEGR
jgi:hypothetical protein